MQRSDGTLTTSSCKCIRCEGFIVVEPVFVDYEWLDQLRCVNCGWVHVRKNIATPRALI